MILRWVCFPTSDRSCTPCRVKVFCTSLLAAIFHQLLEFHESQTTPPPLLSLTSFPMLLISRRNAWKGMHPMSVMGVREGGTFSYMGLPARGGRVWLVREISVSVTCFGYCIVKLFVKSIHSNCRRIFYSCHIVIPLATVFSGVHRS